MNSLKYLVSWLLQRYRFQREKGFRKLDLFLSLGETVGAALTDLCATEGDGPVIENSFVGRT